MRSKAGIYKEKGVINKIDAIYALKEGACSRDIKGRVYYLVSTLTRRSGKMIIPEKSIKSLLKNKEISQQDVDNIKPY